MIDSDSGDESKGNSYDPNEFDDENDQVEEIK